MLPFLLLSAAGLLAGAMNAIAGGGSFVTFPVMVFAGLPPVIANASSTVALFPGTIASTFAYRHDLHGIGGFRLTVLAPLSFAAGVVGAMLLLATPAHLFDAVIPFLLLLAALTFAFGARAGIALRQVIRIGPRALPFVQFVIATYGGYFGGAVGLMMMASWCLLTESDDLKAMTPARVLLTSAANGGAVLCFIIAGAVRWPETLAMLAASVIGGYLGARLTRLLPPAIVRRFVIALTALVTLVFFLRMI
ncbi:MAG TPA: sulfite exporter TauE/SafE family protein [Acetobacteraceae bacterium]|jgi:hypothetical protein|nr:sulfite exporter TauE/SafE family protein [Acetobacteraceae bacterium]